MTPKVLLLCIGVLYCAAAYGASNATSDFLTAPIDREQLARKLVDFSRTPINIQDMHCWAQRLEHKELVRAGADMEKPLQIREIALAVLEAATGEAFSVVKSGRATPVKEIVMCRIGNTPWRFHIADLTEGDYESVARNVEFWIAGYEAALKKHKKRR